jgi:hypothetical protein
VSGAIEQPGLRRVVKARQQHGFDLLNTQGRRLGEQLRCRLNRSGHQGRHQGSQKGFPQGLALPITPGGRFCWISERAVAGRKRRPRQPANARAEVRRDRLGTPGLVLTLMGEQLEHGGKSAVASVCRLMPCRGTGVRKGARKERPQIDSRTVGLGSPGHDPWLIISSRLHGRESWRSNRQQNASNPFTFAFGLNECGDQRPCQGPQLTRVVLAFLCGESSNDGQTLTSRAVLA